MDKAQLQQLSRVDITGADTSTLVDLRHIRVDSALPPAGKLQAYVAQIGNPYCFRWGDIPIKIQFASEGRPLEQMLCDYFLSLN